MPANPIVGDGKYSPDESLKETKALGFKRFVSACDAIRHYAQWRAYVV